MRMTKRQLTTGMALGVATCGLAAPAAFAQTGGPVEQGDLAFGLSDSDPAETAQLVRDGALQGNWTFTSFLQSMEFDNLGGNGHNANGNLLALNFGTTGDGGSLWSLATDGADTGSQIYAFDGTNEQLTRIGGLSVSPDNSMVAAIGFDSGALVLLDYTAGDGSGNGAADFFLEEANFAATGATQGTAWIDENTVAAALLGFSLGDLDIVTFNVDTGDITTVAGISGLQTGSEFTDIDYNPDVSPFVYAVYSSFSGGTENTLAIFDPSDWSLVNRVDLSDSLNTAREIALGFQDNAAALYLGQFGGTVDVLDISDPANIADNSSADYYDSGVFASFNGLDFAVTGGAPSDCLTLAVDNLVGGERATFQIAGGTPTVYGLREGQTVVNDVAGYCATFGIQGVNQSRVLGGLNQIFDNNGEIAFEQPIPSGASGTRVLFQSAERGTCPDECVSNLVDQVVQ